MFLLVLLLGAFTLNRIYIHPWFTGAYWALPLQYLQNAFVINEFTARAHPASSPSKSQVTIFTNIGLKLVKKWCLPSRPSLPLRCPVSTPAAACSALAEAEPGRSDERPAARRGHSGTGRLPLFPQLGAALSSRWAGL